LPKRHGEPEGALWAFEAALRLAGRRGSDPSPLAELHLWLGVARRWLGKTEESQDALERALEVEEPFHDQHRIGVWYLGLATAAAGRGQFEEAVEQAGRSHAVFGAIGHKRRLAEIHQRLGEAESGVGRWAEAQQHYQLSASLHTVASHWEGAAQALGGFAQALLERASPEAARAMGETVLNLLPAEG